MSKRIALLVSNHTYQDPKLAQLKRPAADIQALAAALREPAIGNFNAVETMMNPSAQELRRRMAELFHWKKRNDLLLLYFSGHGLLDETGQLYLVTIDTVSGSLAETAVPATYLTGCMDRSFSRQQILILDCCYTRFCSPDCQNDLSASIRTASIFKGRGLGRVVLAATDRIHSTWIGDDRMGQIANSDFTPCLIQALRTGAADMDQDGQVDMGELSTYLHSQMMRSSGQSLPRYWTYGEQDKFIVARNPHKFEPARPIKWDLIFGAVMAPTATLVIGGRADLSAAVGMAGLFLLLYAWLYWVLD